MPVISSSDFLLKVTDLIKVEDLPEPINRLSPTMNTLLSKAYYNNYKVVRNRDGEGGGGTISIIFPETIGFEIPGTDLKVLLNPSYS